MSTETIFSLAYTSCRANAIPVAVNLWRSRAKNPGQIEVVIAVDGNNMAACIAANSVPGAKVVIQGTPPYNCVRGWNKAAEATTGKVIICIADDFVPPIGWDTALLSLTPNDWIDSERVIKVEDGYVHDIFVLSILTRKRYERFGYVFYPQYESMFCLHPETKIWMENLDFKQIQHINPGDVVVGYERRFGKTGAKHKRKFLCQAQVTQVLKRQSSMIRLSMQSGRQVVCTPDHFWAYYGDVRLSKSERPLRDKNSPTIVEYGYRFGHPKIHNQLVSVTNLPGQIDYSGVKLQELGWQAISDKIIKIDDAGDGLVYCLKTASGNYVANGYLSHNCDTEFGEVAIRDGVVINANHLLFEHMHPDCGKRPRDENDKLHGGKDRWNRGELLYKYRKSCGFPVDDGPKAGIVDKTVEVKTGKYAVYIQATKDDFCLFEVCQRMIDEGATDFFFCIPDEYWSGEKTPQAEINEVQGIADRVKAAGGNINIKVFKVADYRFPGDSRISVETRVRNDTLAWIRRSGFKHILVVDGDELWARGMLAKVDECVSTSNPPCISCPMVPVVGLPGYPIHMATDRAIVYVGGSTVFRECRSPAIEHFMLNNCIVIHFTATRKTMQEIVDKHRNSGHYDDPEYDFEGWIKNVLPNLKPGWRGAHMYKRYQIWPIVRNWTISEMDHIPESIRQYLGNPVDEPSPILMALDRRNRLCDPKLAKPNPVRLKTQVEQFLGQSLNPYQR